MEIKLRELTVSDAGLWLAVQKSAFAAYLAKYQDYTISPAAESIERVLSRMGSPFARHYFILAGGEVAGGTRISWWEGTARYRLGGMFLLEEYQNAGIGQRAVRMVENLYPDAASWELDTILQEPRLAHFYEKLGYRREGGETVINDKMSTVFYRKTMPVGE